MKYKYIRESWEKPVNYNFSSYHGNSFIKSFINIRNKKIADLDISIKKNNSNKINEKKFSTRQSETTHDLNSEVQLIIKDNRVSSKLDFYIKKFEINKLIFNKYDEKGFGLGLHDNVLNYTVLSKACLEAYKLDKNLKYLNTALKLNDILIFLPPNSISELYLLQIKEVFLLEKEIIMSFFK